MIPLTLVATSGVRRSRQRIVNEAIVAAVVILVMGLVGHAVLAYLGITLPAFTIAGGILLFLIAIDMLFARPTGAKQTAEETREASEANNPAVFPLAIPMIAGPGTIATVCCSLGSRTATGARADRVRGLRAALIVTWLCMSAATYLQRIIGKTGIHVVTRLLGIILAALAVQFVINGLIGTPLSCTGRNGLRRPGISAVDRNVPGEGASLRLYGLARVKNEADIIEEFVRHNLRYVDALTVVDNVSLDNTALVLEPLVDEGLPLRVLHDASLPKRQYETMTRVARDSLASTDWDFLFLLDADEFVVAPDRDALERSLGALAPDTCGLLPWRTYIPTADHSP